MSPLMKQCIGTKHEACTTLIPIGVKRCPKHSLAEKRRRDTHRNQRPHRHVYDDPRWHAARRIVLERDGQCVLCGNPPTIADHHPTPLPLCPDPFDTENLRALCHRCSGIEDGRRSHGGVHPDSGRGLPTRSPNPRVTETPRLVF